MKPTNPPHILTQADDGQWYLVPESKLARFEELIGLLQIGDYSDAALKKMEAYKRYHIGEDLGSLRIFQWEETR